MFADRERHLQQIPENARSFVDAKNGIEIAEYISESECIAIETDLAKQLRHLYAKSDPLFVIVEKGAAVFGMSVFSQLEIPNAELEFVQTASYGKNMDSSGEVEVKKGLEQINLSGRDVALLEDIIDSGNTLAKLLQRIHQLPLDQQPNSLIICTLLSKPSRRETYVDIDYIGKEIPDVFVVGRGLDYQERYRSLPYIGVVKPI